MLAVDWLGSLLTAALLALVLRGARRPPRALLALLLGETGRVLLALLLGAELSAVTVGGAFTRLQVSGPPYLLIQLGGLLVGAVLGLLLGRRAALDALLYALLASAVTLFLSW